MKAKTNNIKSKERENFYKLLNNVSDKEFFTIKKITELILAKENELLSILANAPYEEKELNEKTKRAIRKSRKEMSEGKSYSIESIRKELKG